jgi:DnaJ like chaperone protein
MAQASIWARIASAVAAIGGSVAGALASLSSRRAAQPEKSVAFTIGMIALGAKMAKADGVVTEDEVTAFRRVFHVEPEDLENVARVFNLAKQDVAGFEFYARQVARLFARKRGVLEDVLDGLFHIAKADGALHAQELGYLAEVARLFGFQESDFDRITARHLDTEADPYRVLGLSREAGPEEIRQRYRKLARDYHPDRHIAAGMPEEMIKIATDRLARINAAYDRIAAERAL